MKTIISFTLFFSFIVLNLYANEPTTHSIMINEVQTNWILPDTSTQPQHTHLPSIQDAHLLTQQLSSIIIPKIHFTDVPLSRALNTLSELSTQFDPHGLGINIVLMDPQGLNPHVSLHLRQTSLQQILNFIAQSTHFSYDIQDNTLVFEYQPGSPFTLDTAFFPISRATIIRLTDLRSPNSKDNRPLVLDEEKALQVFFQKAGIDFENTPGSSLAFEGTMLIVTHTPRNIERIRNILDRYKDIKQVEIQAKFIEVQEGALEELGIRWQAKHKDSFVQSGSGNTDNLRSLSQTFVNPSASSGNGSIVVNNQETTIPNSPPQISNTLNLATNSVSAANIMGVLGSIDLNIILKALEQQGSADLMSCPKLTVLSGKKAHIVVAQEFRYPESFGDIGSDVGSSNLNGGGSAGVSITAGTPKNFTVRNIGVEMEVTPTVEENNNITLVLEPKVTEFEGFVEYGGRSIAVTGSTTVEIPSGFFQPIFSTRKIHTEVTIHNGATVVMGGLSREEIKKVHDKVPFLGDLPLLGRLFQSKGETNQKKNLLIFITANLISPSGLRIGQEQPNL